MINRGKYYELDNGTKRVYKDGHAPDYLEGWEQDQFDQNLFRKKYPECKYREKFEVKLRCGKKKSGQKCNLKNLIFITQDICEECKERET